MTSNLTLVDGPGSDKEKEIATLEPFVPTTPETPSKEHSKPTMGEGNILFLEPLPLKMSYKRVSREFEKYGNIKEIRLQEVNDYSAWQAWITFTNYTDASHAYEASFEIGTYDKCSIVAKAPQYLDVYRPSDWQIQQDPENELAPNITRIPEPPKWLIATSRAERCNIIKMSKFIKSEVGSISKNKISRFGRNSLLIEAKSTTQSLALLGMEIEPDGILKEIKPHYNFSYGKGVIFSEDIYFFY